GSYKSLEKFICEDVWMLMGGGWGLSLILLFRVVFVPLACGRDTNQKKTRIARTLHGLVFHGSFF
ncbi:MAG: hypothetical protein SO214_04855, partial [Prevotella pectinovora]|uniref:hypothetical protein n=1 Tax=Prevotella pectinovora TaxID=1602169 RepID=UPI002A8095A1